jgi:predicted metal-dependent hydrolase
LLDSDEEEDKDEDLEKKNLKKRVKNALNKAADNLVPYRVGQYSKLGKRRGIIPRLRQKHAVNFRPPKPYK